MLSSVNLIYYSINRIGTKKGVRTIYNNRTKANGYLETEVG